MIVCEHYTRASVCGGVRDNLPKRKLAPALITLVIGDVKAPCLFIDVSDPEVLAVGVPFRQAAAEEFACRSQAIELHRKIGTLIPHDF
jgi:hypothetical protein